MLSSTMHYLQIAEQTLPSRTELHLIRKIWHMGVGFLLLVGYFVLRMNPQQAALAGFSLTLLILSWEWTRLRSPKVNEKSIKIFKPLLRSSETKKISGISYYTLGVALTFALFTEQLAILSVLFLIFADPIASLVGIKWGRDKITRNKSLQGCVASFGTCYLVTLVYGLLLTGTSFELLLYALIAGVIGSVAELINLKLDDNLSLPLISGLGLTLLNHFIPLF